MFKAFKTFDKFLSMTLKDYTEHSQGCLMAYKGACNGRMKSQDGVIGLSRMRIRSNGNNTTTCAKESKLEYYLGQISHEKKA